MCFSAPVSALAAAVTAGAGGVAVLHCRQRRELPLATMPLLFSLQQAGESLLWLYLPHGPRASVLLLANVFAAIALVVWPLWVPLAVGLLEPPRRRALSVVLAVAGLIAAGYGVLALAHRPVEVTLAQGSICYLSPWPYPWSIVAAYLIAACLPPLLSSHTQLQMFGGVVTAGMAMSYAVYREAFLSVWCFFAAVASVMLARYFHARVTDRPLFPAR